jgi:hypothetical protein
MFYTMEYRLNHLMGNMVYRYGRGFYNPEFYNKIIKDGLAESPDSDGFVKRPRSRRANLEE